MALPFIEVIEEITPDPNLLMWKFADADKEIKNGAVLTVRESQSVLFLNEGQQADVFTAGKHVLETENIPLLTRLKGWKYGFKSPFKADIYFFNTFQFVNLKWGTPAPVLMRDNKFGQVRVRAFGTYNVRITDVGKFFKEYAGTYPRLGIVELELQLRDFIAPKFGEVLAQADISVLDIAGNISVLNEKIQPLIQPNFTDLGLEVTRFTVTSATLPEEVLKHYDNVTGMNMVTDMDKFTQFNIANAMDKDNNKVADAAQQAVALSVMLNQIKPAAAAQPEQIQQEDITSRLKKLKGLFEAELITEAEYITKKEELLRLL
ncbi:Membrane protease subunit, stomatin/prohibitin family, contains C-terminal Zn-ribbon domain [Chitinophaga sp. CF118]|uniref:SPFH domain-containing protein n=1 Tax=Chitinophaga sp. CF118 TaxID=1884367 RepID=UPI0008EF38A7|nr:SPFH domain-containing protein [Chitinophaga sp. CF118]SFE58303.1 Membrane protease subunit, stomatin/prohibitin family, contains C-terminal Zn-ribbon domain [Chitinophaga sp. CF118]